MHNPFNPHILWDSPSWQLMRLPFSTRPLLNLNISTFFLAKHTKIKLIMGKNRVSKPMERRILILLMNPFTLCLKELCYQLYRIYNTNFRAKFCLTLKAPELVRHKDHGFYTYPNCIEQIPVIEAQTGPIRIIFVFEFPVEYLDKKVLDPPLCAVRPSVWSTPSACNLLGCLWSSGVIITNFKWKNKIP